MWSGTVQVLSGVGVDMSSLHYVVNNLATNPYTEELDGSQTTCSIYLLYRMEWDKRSRTVEGSEWGVLLEVLVPLELGLILVTLKIEDQFLTGNKEHSTC
jgi:hypothetical protein